MKSERVIESDANFRGDQMWYCGRLHINRPSQSPILKIRKWSEINKMGEKKLSEESFRTDRIELVMGGKTACRILVNYHSNVIIKSPYQGNNENPCNDKVI